MSINTALAEVVEENSLEELNRRILEILANSDNG